MASSRSSPSTGRPGASSDGGGLDRAAGRVPLVPRSPLAVVLAGGWLVVVGAGLAVELVHARSHAPAVETAVSLLSLSYEQNLPTWYASCLLFSASLALAGVAGGAARDRFRWHWWGLCAGFAYMSLDEAVELHERLGGHFGGSGVLYFDWVIPAAALLVVLAAVYAPFLRGLPEPARRRFAIAGAIYVAGAVAMELPLGWWTEQAGPDNLTYALIDWVEEALELVGASLFVAAVVAHRAERADTEARG